jgi:hypothetical protein
VTSDRSPSIPKRPQKVTSTATKAKGRASSTAAKKAKATRRKPSSSSASASPAARSGFQQKTLHDLFSPEAMMAKRIKGVYSIVNRLHEPIPPIGSDDYALTGNVTAGSFGLFIRTLMGLARHPERYGNAAAPATPRSGSNSGSSSSSGVALVAATRGLDEVRVPNSRRQLARNKMRCVRSTCRRGESAFSRTPARSCALVCVSPYAERKVCCEECLWMFVGGWSGASWVCELDVGVLRLFTRLLDP